VEIPVCRKLSHHIDIRRYFVRELVKAGFVKLIPLRTHKMVANALTKSLPSPAALEYLVALQHRVALQNLALEYRVALHCVTLQYRVAL